MFQRAVSSSLRAALSVSICQTTLQQGPCHPQPSPISSTPAVAASLPVWAIAACCAWASSSREMADPKAGVLRRLQCAVTNIFPASGCEQACSLLQGRRTPRWTACISECAKAAHGFTLKRNQIPALTRIFAICRIATALPTGDHKWRVCNSCLQLPVLCQAIGVLGIHCRAP